MGTAVVNCTAGCFCKPLKIDAHHPDVKVSVFLNSGFLVRRQQQP